MIEFIRQYGPLLVLPACIAVIFSIYVIALVVDFINRKRFQPIYAYYYSTFEGEKVKNVYMKYRQHRKTGRVQTFNWDSQGGSWDYIGKTKSDIVIKKVEESEDGIIKD